MSEYIFGFKGSDDEDEIHIAELVIDSDQYHAHVCAITREGLHAKADFAFELAYRDLTIEQLTKERDDAINAEKKAFWFAFERAKTHESMIISGAWIHYLALTGRGKEVELAKHSGEEK